MNLSPRSNRPLKNPRPDVRALWDWYYLSLIRYDNTAVYEAGKGLAKVAPADPLALWAYLYAIGGRQTGLGQQYYVYQGQDQRDTTPPLETDELENVLACYRSLKTRRPELVQAQILQHVFKELKRAKRVEQEEKLYREAIAGATQLAQIAGVFSLAAERGDVEGLLQLFDRFERLQTGRGTQYYNTGTFYFNGPGTALGTRHERSRRAKGIWRRPPDARPRTGRRPPQTGKAIAGRRKGRASAVRDARRFDQLSDLGGQGHATTCRSHFRSRMNISTRRPSRSCARRMSSSSATTS